MKDFFLLVFWYFSFFATFFFLCRERVSEKSKFISGPEQKNFRVEAFKILKMKTENFRTEADVTLLDVASLFAVIGHRLPRQMCDRPTSGSKMHRSTQHCTVASL